MSLKRRELIKLGYGRKDLMEPALAAVAEATEAGVAKAVLRRRMVALIDHPEGFVEDEQLGELARRVGQERDLAEVSSGFVPRARAAPYRRWGNDADRQTLDQIENACQLPIAARAALMPDAHVGYGLPIGGVLATRGAVIPYAVGVDIACRMKLTAFDLPVSRLDGHRDQLKRVLVDETRFGLGAEFRGQRRHHDVLDEDWSVSPVTQRFKDKGWRQLGTSGSGNHFVEFGILTLADSADRHATVDGSDVLDLAPGQYVALLSHSGSRGVGASVASHYSSLAMKLHPELPKPLKHLAWLDLDEDMGQEYWQAMELMGHYAAANHALIHQHIARALGVDVLLDVENHHNFAWLEEHDGETLVVHRKGATPAGKGVLGVIPGSMASPAFIVRGRGQPDSLHSASHGAGRLMSRTRAKQTFTWSDTRKLLAEKGVEVLSCGIDEVPGVYRDIEQVMAAQEDLVETLARFDPKIVKMAPPGERPED
jgi:tRNA-splicing ligase RtcB